MVVVAYKDMAGSCPGCLLGADSRSLSPGKGVVGLEVFGVERFKSRDS